VDLGSDLCQRPPEVISEGVGQAGADDVNRAAVAQEFHRAVHLIYVEAFVQLFEVVDFGIDHSAEPLGFGRLHVGQAHPVDQRQLRVNDISQLLEEITVSFVSQLIDKADDRRFADPRRPRKLPGCHEDHFARVVEDVVPDEARLGGEVSAVRRDPLQQQVGSHRYVSDEINATFDMNSNQGLILNLVSTISPGQLSTKIASMVNIN